jgi:hypothetical protein
VVKKGSVVSILRVSTKRGRDNEKLQSYPLRYVEDFFGVSNEVAPSAEALSEGGSQTIELGERKSFFTSLLVDS